MPDTAALRARDAATAEAIARFGEDNLEAILEVYRAFADRVDYRELVSWTLKDPLEDLLLPLFLRALVEITKTLDLGRLAEEMKATKADRAALAEEIVKALNETVRVASGSSYYDGVNDTLALLRGVDPQALLEANVAKRKERLGW